MKYIIYDWICSRSSKYPNFFCYVTSQLIFTCSKSTIETPEKGVKYVKLTIKAPEDVIDVVFYFYCSFWKYFSMFLIWFCLHFFVTSFKIVQTFMELNLFFSCINQDGSLKVIVFYLQCYSFRLVLVFASLNIFQKMAF